MFRHLFAGLLLLAVTDSGPFFVRRSGGCTSGCTFAGATAFTGTVDFTNQPTMDGFAGHASTQVTVQAASGVDTQVGADLGNTNVFIHGVGGHIDMNGTVTFPSGVSGGVTIGGGTSTDTLTVGAGSGVLNKISKGTTTSPAAQGAASCSDVAVTVTGAAVGDFCWVAAPSGAMGSLDFTCYVTASNTAQLHKCNYTAGSLTPATGTYTLWAGH